MVDSHCHLADDAFAVDHEEVINRARAVGISSGLCILEAGDEGQSTRANKLIEVWPELRFAVGVHPHHAGNFSERPEAAADLLRESVHGNEATRAIGEIGLDYHYDLSAREIQKQVFRAQIRLARELGLPIVIHTREAEEDTFDVLRDEGEGQLSGIFHCFTGDVKMAREVLDLGFHLSFSGIVTFPRSTEIRETAKMVPANRLLVETDCPYLAPAPYRGKRNEPAWVAYVVGTLAEVRCEAAESVASNTEHTFMTLIRP